MPTEASIACRPMPNANPLRVADAVLDERERDRRLDETEVPRPEREDRRHVHQHEHEPGCRQAARGCRTRASRRTRRAAGRASRGTGGRPRTSRGERLVHDARARACAIVTSRRTGPSLVEHRSAGDAARSASANANRPTPIAATSVRLVIAQCGIFAVDEHVRRSAATPGTGRRPDARRPSRRASPTRRRDRAAVA